MQNRTDTCSIRRAVALGALSLALSLPLTLQAQLPTPATEAASSLMDLPLPGTTPPPAAAPAPDQPSPVTPSAVPAPAMLPAMPEAVTPPAAIIAPPPTTTTPEAESISVPAAPLKEIPPALSTPASAPVQAAGPSPKEAAPNEEITRKVQIISPKILSIEGPPPINLLEYPLQLDQGLSLMFSEKDMFSLVIPGLELYDKVDSTDNKASSDTEAAGDLTGLLESLKSKGQDRAKEVESPLPNIYLGSIMYYSPSNWSIWLNGKKVTNTVNAPTNALYVQSIDRSHVKLVWKPASMTALNKVLDERKVATPEVLDIDGSRVTVTMRPNQTFVTSLLAVLEGLVRQSAVSAPVTGTHTNSGSVEPAAIPAKGQPGKYQPMDNHSQQK